jgi:AcrR family transcriptional regulator
LNLFESGLARGPEQHHFPSKDALVFAFYADTQTELEGVALTARGSPRERLGALFHAKLRQVRPYRKMLASIVPRLIDPGDPVSAFSAPWHEVRARSISILARARESMRLPRDARALAALGRAGIELTSM